ncbi:MAG: hypothetical protein ABJA87_06455 [bacterium]
MISAAAIAWLVAPFAGPVAGLLFRLPMVQIAVLALRQRRMRA